MMDCERTTELLPWLLNGTLEAAEQQQVREHLAQCEKCQQELNETMVAWVVYQQHIPTETLIDYAFERPIVGAEQELIERHLKTCRECADQFELVRESWRGESEEGVEVKPVVLEKARWWHTIPWPYAALAASFIGLIAVGGWLWSWQQGRALQASLTEQQRVMQDRVAKLEAENQRLRQAEAQLRQQQDQASREIAQLQERVKNLASPQINIPVLDVYPIELARRTQRPLVNDLQIPPSAKAVTLILSAQSPASYRSYSIEILDARKTIVWSAPGLVRHPTDDYTIILPVELIPPGSYTLHVYGEARGKRVRVESYQIRIRY